MLKHTAPIVGLLLAEGSVEQVFKDAIEGMAELVKHLPEASHLGGGHGEMDRAEGLTLRALRHLLDELDPAAQWGGLRKVLTPEQHYLWLCEEHMAEVRR